MAVRLIGLKIDIKFQGIFLYHHFLAVDRQIEQLVAVFGETRKEDIRMMSWGGTNISYSRSKSLVADTLNG